MTAETIDGDHDTATLDLFRTEILRRVAASGWSVARSNETAALMRAAARCGHQVLYRSARAIWRSHGERT